jgi:hypothetical protein
MGPGGPMGPVAPVAPATFFFLQQRDRGPLHVHGIVARSVLLNSALQKNLAAHTVDRKKVFVNVFGAKQKKHWPWTVSV